MLSQCLFWFWFIEKIPLCINRQPAATIMKEIVGTPDVIYYNDPHAYHWSRKWGMAYSIESKSSRYSSAPPSINVGGSGKASDIRIRSNIALREWGYFSPKVEKVCQQYFPWL